ncbi:MAG: YidC/Oxa1 family membrane protein insertase [Clostridia bacterium]|nr:YidC/Oxa1 family membrane protein insertase [Clostridia bacterium]
MFQIFEYLAIPLGWILKVIYQLVGNYFVAIFLFTLLIKLATFPFSLKSQKASADRARLAPRLERIQKKYANNRELMQKKSQELYEKEGVSMTGGCMTMLIPMIILFGVIAAIYKPLTHMTSIPNQVIESSITAITATKEETENRISEADAKSGSYYRELRLMSLMDKGNNKELIVAAIDKLDAKTRANLSGAEYYAQFEEMSDQFHIGSLNFLDNPWNGGFAGINWLWIVPLISGITALFSSLLSMHFSRGSMSQEQQQMQGCTNGMMYFMPLMSVYIAFIVPAAVGVYWISSNLTGLLQTYILNKMYNPAKIRAQAEIEYQERRARRAAQKAEEKKRLAESRRREEEREAADQPAPAPDPKKGKKKAEKALPVEMPEEIRAEQDDDTNNPSANTDETEK